MLPYHAKATQLPLIVIPKSCKGKFDIFSYILEILGGIRKQKEQQQHQLDYQYTVNKNNTLLFVI